MDILQEKKPLLVKAELDTDYKFKAPMESYRFDILYIGGVDSLNQQNLSKADVIAQFPLTPKQCFKLEQKKEGN